jgi:hypothetical protein
LVSEEEREEKKKRIDFILFHHTYVYIALETWNIRLPNLGRQKEIYREKEMCAVFDRIELSYL